MVYLLDPLQFAYRAKQVGWWDSRYRTALYPVTPGLPRGICSLVDIRLAFCVNIFEILISKLTAPASNCEWITNLLTEKKQQGRLGESKSSTISTGSAQGNGLPSALFPLHNWRHFRKHVHYIFKVCRQLTQLSDKTVIQEEMPHPGWWQVCIQTGGLTVGPLEPI